MPSQSVYSNHGLIGSLASTDGSSTAKVRRIAIAVDAVWEYGRGVIRGVLAHTRLNPDWRIAVEPRWSFESLDQVSSWEVDGIIAQAYDLPFEQAVIDTGVPAVNVSNFMASQRLPVVVPDDLAVGEMAADYLLARGFRNLGFLGPLDLEYSALRCQAFRRRVEEEGAHFYLCEARECDIGEWALQLPRPIAVMGANDDWAHRLLKVARKMEIRVPDALAVLGVDNDQLFNDLVTPTLSSIAIPAEQIGMQAAAMLDQMLDGKTIAKKNVTLNPLRVVPRESTETVAVADPELAAVLQFIRSNAHRPLQVEDLLERAAMSRRSMERRFRLLLGRSVSAEIRRAHVDRAKQLLLETDFSMYRIARASGFNDATRLGIVFRRAVGVLPSEFRAGARGLGSG